MSEKFTFNIDEIFARLGGYDPNDPVRGLEIPDKLVEDLGLEKDEDDGESA